MALNPPKREAEWIMRLGIDGTRRIMTYVDVFLAYSKL